MSEETKQKISKTLTGRVFSEEHRQKLSQNKTNFYLDPIHCLEQSERMKPILSDIKFRERIRKLGIIRWKNLGFRGRVIKGMIKSWENPERKEKKLLQVFPFKDTLIEKALQGVLENKNISFQKHYPILGQPDIFIEPNICIFADGCYWHSCPKCFPEGTIKRNDKEITENLESKGYTVLRFWEHDIKNDLEGCIKRIDEALVGVSK